MKCRATLLERDMLFTSLAFVPLALGAPPLGAGAGAQKIEAPTVPARFHGEWARTAEQCGLSAAAVENLTIGSRHILSVPVVRVEQAADSGRVKVWLRPADRSAQELVLELNGDVLVVTTQDGQSVEAVNCSRQEPDFSLAIENSWLELASAACQSGNFNDFLEAFFSSEAVKRKYLARKILVAREGAPGKFVDQAFYSAPPIMLSHYQGEMNLVLEDGSRSAAVVHFVVKKDRQGNWTISWATSAPENERMFEENPEKVLQGGVLVFRRNKTCWNLAEERIGLPDE